jgi:hypothetical protein
MRVMSVREDRREAGNQYVNVEKWREAVAELRAMRERMNDACDAADFAASQAGTPIRTSSLRAQLAAVSAEILRLDEQIMSAVSGESAVAGSVASRRTSLSSTIAEMRKLRAKREIDTGRLARRTHLADAPTGGFASAARLWNQRLVDRVSFQRVTGSSTQSISVPTIPRDPVPTVPSRSAPTIPKSPVTLQPAVNSNPVVSSIPGPDRSPASDAKLAAIRKLLTDGRWGEDHVTRGELEDLVKIFDDLHSLEANWLIQALTDSELKLIADEMDSRGIGNYNGLSSRKKEAYISLLATKLDGVGFLRIIRAFDDRDQFARVLCATPGAVAAKLAFVAECERKVGDLTKQRAGGETEKWLRAIAQVLGGLEARPLGLYLRAHAENPLLLAGIFRASTGADLDISVSGSAASFSSNSEVSFQPDALRQLALALAKLGPEYESERFVAFQTFTKTLSWAFASSQSVNGTRELRELVLASYPLLGTNPVEFIDKHKYELDTFRTWASLVLRSGNSRMLISILSSIKQSTRKSDVFFMGYIVGLIQRAESALVDDMRAKIDLALGIVGALLNAFSPAIVVSGTLGVVTLQTVTSRIEGGTPLWEVVSEQVAQRLNSDPSANALFFAGRLMGSE